MKNQIRLFFSKYIFIPLVFSLAGCGGGSSNTGSVSNEPNIGTESNDSTRPIFLARDVSIAPSSSPNGDITDTTPTFTWQSILNASEYQYGHEQPTNLETWRSYTISAEDLNCNISVEDICSNTPSDYTFTVGEERAWWVRAKIDGIWAEWSAPHTFTIISEDPISIGVPNAITPTGDIIDTTPEFSWSSVQNTTEYQLGHEDLDTREWQNYSVSKEQAGCLVIGQTCTFTPSDLNFEVGDRIGWWVRARNGGVWGEWSIVSKFTIIPETTNLIPEQFTPTGDISTTSPVFSWSRIEGATEYILSHEETVTNANLQEYTITPVQASCQNVNENCTYTLSENTFNTEDNISWKVRALVDGNLQEWSLISKFTIIPQTTNLIPEQFTPTGDISTTSPVFSWSRIEGATEYILGHEETDESLNWQQYPITPTQATCQNVNENCTYTLPETTFNAGVNLSWWVRALVGDNIQDWSVGKKFKVTNPPQAGLKINEVLAANTHTNLDPDFHQFSDWIELYNPTSQNINISNYGLSDDDEDPLQWKFPEGTIIEANSYLLVWADDEDKEDNTALHTNFKLSSKGEKLTLADTSGTIIDSIEFEAQESDVSTGKLNDVIVFMTPTPRALNGTAYPSKDLSKAPNFTFESGFFNAPITVALSQENGADIYYTTDGSTPNTNSQKYIQPININETTVIRAISDEVGALPSEIISTSYFINHTSNLPVISLTTDPGYIFDPKTGIYTDGDGTNGVPLFQCNSQATQPVNYAQEWERPIHMEYFGINRESEFSLTSGISISGQCSRSNQKKSFSFELDSKFGTKTLEYKLFESKDVEKFKDFKLRTGASGYELSDLLAAKLIHTANLNIDYQAYRTSQVFVNGEYWGLYNFREKKGADFIVSNYPDIDKDELDIINQGYTAKTGDTDDYNTLVLLLETLNLDLSNDADYQQIIGKIDESNYIDYMALMIYSANFDWISSNQRSWKEKKEGAKWRWMADDVDSGFQAEAIELDLFTALIQADFPDAMVHSFRGLTKNATFNQKFKSRFTELLDTTFSPSNMLNQINTIVDERDDYIPLENAKWSSITIEKFDRHIESLKLFANARNSIVKSQLDIFIP